MSKVKDFGQAVSVLVQVAELAQSKGILKLDEAVLVKESIDLIKKIATSKDPKNNKNIDESEISMKDEEK